MKKVIALIFIGLFSQPVMAEGRGDMLDERVLTAIHEKGFKGCDQAIQKYFGAEDNAIDRVDATDRIDAYPVFDDHINIILGFKKSGSFAKYEIRRAGKKCAIWKDMSAYILGDARDQCLKSLNGIDQPVLEGERITWLEPRQGSRMKGPSVLIGSEYPDNSGYTWCTLIQLNLIKTNPRFMNILNAD